MEDKHFVRMYQLMVLIRKFEEGAVRLAQEGMHKNYHPSIGQEAVAVGTCYNLRYDDMIMPTHRGMGMFITKGVNTGELMAGLLNKGSTCTRGKTPIIHLARVDLGILAGTAMLGSCISLAIGSALATKLRNKDQVTLSFFGDGAANRGDFHEALNLASLWNLPVIFICENNFYAKSVHVSRMVAGGSISNRAYSYGMEGHVVDGNDVISVYQSTQEAIRKARQGQGPTLLEMQTYRILPHSLPGRDDKDQYRPKEEIEYWKARCPIKTFEKRLLADGILTPEKCKDIHEEASKEVEQAITYAKEAPYAPAEAAFEGVYVL